MTKEYYDADQLKIYEAFEQKLVPINTSISGINGEITTIKTNITSNTTSITNIKTELETITDAIDISDTEIKFNRAALILFGVEIKGIQAGSEIHDQKLFTLKYYETNIVDRLLHYSLTTHTHIETKEIWYL